MSKELHSTVCIRFPVRTSSTCFHNYTGVWSAVAKPGCVISSATQKYEEAAEVHRKVKLLGDCMRQYFQVVRTHVSMQVDSKMVDTGGRKWTPVPTYKYI